MNKKQITGLIAAALVFVFVCGSSMVIRSFAGQQENNYFDKLLKASEDVSKDFPTFLHILPVPDGGLRP